jgi:Transglutaminase-like superfamily
VRQFVFRFNLLFEATITLIFAALSVRFLPTARIIARANRSSRSPYRSVSPRIIDAVCLSVDEIGTKIHAVCLPRALAVQSMLRRRGVAVHLCLGVAREADRLAAHAWIELDNGIRGGGHSDRKGFTRLVAFG